MAKVKGGKGKKGKKGKKKKKTPKIDPNALTEVDRTFYELTITDLNRKLARLRSLTAELEEKNEQLTNDLAKLDEDRNDIIIYLKRILQERSDEIAELQERLRALEETRQEETENYEQKIVDLENEYRQMHEQLTSEIKLLEGKLNSLEEFRIQRDELMKKFEDQEIQMEEQEKRHKEELYEIERKFIIGKDKLKKDMEARLLQLSSEFQDATEVRIAATTHRVIRENIAINNELDLMLQTHEKLHAENADLKENNRILRQEAELHEAEKKRALAKVKIQLKIIERLTKEHEEMTSKLSRYLTIEQEMHQVSAELQKTKEMVSCLNHQIRILEQNVHALKCKECSLQTELNNVQADNDRLSIILAQAVFAIKDVLELHTKIADEGLRASKRESLLTQLFILLSEAEMKKTRRPSLDTVGSLSATYERGDLGFVPKSLSRRSTIPTIRHIEAQTGPSFDEFIEIGKADDVIQKFDTSLISSEEESRGSEMVSFEEQSDVYFDEEEDTMEDSLEFDDVESFEDDEDYVQHRKSTRASKLKGSVHERVGSIQVSETKISKEDDESKRRGSKGSKTSKSSGPHVSPSRTEPTSTSSRISIKPKPSRASSVRIMSTQIEPQKIRKSKGSDVSVDVGRHSGEKRRSSQAGRTSSVHKTESETESRRRSSVKPKSSKGSVKQVPSTETGARRDTKSSASKTSLAFGPDTDTVKARTSSQGAGSETDVKRQSLHGKGSGIVETDASSAPRGSLGDRGRISESGDESGPSRASVVPETGDVTTAPTSPADSSPGPDTEDSSRPTQPSEPAK